MKPIPYIEGTGKLATLYVDGKPFYCRGGELHNSAASSPEFMSAKVWPALRPLHLNTVIVPVYWECLEPEKSVFDYALVDSLLVQAREEGVRLILLWFGLWKNSASSYIPQWMKLDRERFWFVVKRDGKLPLHHDRPHRIVSPFCQEAVDADANAFSHLMAHLKEVDEDRTVIMVQVENEIGVLGADRDYSEAADAAYAAPVPAALAEAMGRPGSWEDVFGEDGPQQFMAWHYALAVEQITKAGKAEYPLPMYANCWLEQEPWIPGTYPSGGPISRNAPVWRVGAPSVELFAPDIYVDDYKGTVALYGTDQNPLFIPETRLSVANYLYSVGTYNCMCFSPFGIEDTFDSEKEQVDLTTMEILHIDPEAFAKQESVGCELACAFDYVSGMEDVIRRAHEENRIRGFLWTADNTEKRELLELSGMNMHIQYNNQKLAGGGGLVIELSDYEFVVLGINCSFHFTSKDGTRLETLTKEEGQFVEGVWKRGRIMNGDERYINMFTSKVGLNYFKYIEE